jgi:flagellar FliL protein
MADKAVAGGANAGGSMLSTLIALTLVTILAAAAGMGIAWYFKSLNKTANEKAGEAAKAAAASVTTVSAGSVLELPSIIGQVGGDRKIWVRLDVSVVVAPDTPAPDINAAYLAEDILAYVRTLSLEDLTTPSAIQVLREDLEERARIRTKGKVRGILFRSFVIE